ncbi:MAG: ABC transporter ATP-binding protein, partial [Armatimonadota bacterium]
MTARHDNWEDDSAKSLDLPQEIRAWAEEWLAADERIEVAAAGDVMPDGRFDVSWLVVTNRRLAVLEFDEEDDDVLVRRELGLDQLDAVEFEHYVGGGLLNALRDGERTELIRFSRTLSDLFEDARDQITAQLREHGRAEAPRGVEERGAEGEHGRTEGGRSRCPTCGRPLAHGDVCRACIDKQRILRRMASYLRPYWPMLVFGIAVTFGATLAQATPAWISKKIVNDAILPRDLAVLTKWVLVLLAVLLMRGLLTWGNSYIIATLGQFIIADIRRSAYLHLQKLAVSFYEKRQTGQLMSRITHDTQHLQEFVGTSMQEILVQLFMVIVVTGIMLGSSTTLTLLVMVPIPFLVLLSIMLGRKVRRFYRSAWRRMGSINAMLADTIPGVRVVKAFAQEPREAERFEQRDRSYVSAVLAAARTRSKFSGLMAMTMGSGALIVWSYGGSQVIAGELDLGTLVMFSGLLWQLYGPVTTLANLNERFQRAATAAERVFEILDTPGETELTPPEHHPHPVTEVHGRIEFDHVFFGYEQDEPVLRDICLDVQAGEMIGLVGRSGVGKTTLVNLICRFYDPNRGVIRMDGEDLRD